MKNRLLFSLGIGALTLGAFALQGCYTQLAMMEENDSSASYESQPADTSESAAPQQDYGYEDDYYQWRPGAYLGFSYYPVWHSYWVSDPYWMSDPWYYDPWYWPGASYWPRPWVYGAPLISFYPGYYYSSYPHSYYGTTYGDYGWRTNGESTPYRTRNSGYRRTGGDTRGVYLYGGSSAGGGSASLPTAGRSGRVEGTFTGRSAPAGTTNRGAVTATRRSTPSASPGTTQRGSTTRRTERMYNPGVQQPQHRAEPAPSGGSRERRSSGWTRSPQRTESSPAPRYSPPARSSAPSSPPPSNSGGGSQGSSDRGSRRR